MIFVLPPPPRISKWNQQPRWLNTREERDAEHKGVPFGGGGQVLNTSTASQQLKTKAVE